MSKYIKLEDAVSICGAKLKLADGAAIGKRHPTPEENVTALLGLPTIEVSEEELRKKYKDFYEQGKFDAMVEVNCEDCISREQFREQMYHRCFEVDNDPNMQKWDSGNWIRWKLFEEELDNAPSVVPSRAEGEWIVKANGNNECSICGREKQNGWVNFCGFCGAKMKG